MFLFLHILYFKLSEWNCCSSDISQKFHPLPPSHPSYKLHEIDSSHWSIYLLNIHLPLTKVNESDKITTIRQYTDSTVHQSTVKRYTGNPVTLGVSVSVRRLSNNLCVNSNDALGGGLSSSITATANTTVTVNEKHSNVQIDKTNDSQWNAVFVRTVIDGGPAYQVSVVMTCLLFIYFLFFNYLLFCFIIIFFQNLFFCCCFSVIFS